MQQHASLPIMDLKKLTFLDKILSLTGRKVGFRSSLWIVSPFFVLSAILCIILFKGPYVNPGSNGFSSFRPISNNGSISSFAEKVEHPCNENEALEANVETDKTSDFGNPDVGNGVLEYDWKETGVNRNGTIFVKAGRSETELGNINVEDDGNSGFIKGTMDLVTRKSFYDCDIFNGQWVRDETKPYYPPSSCPYIDKAFDCHLNGRPDSEYMKWRWQPYNCDIPSLNTTDFLERLRGKKLVFVGDSLNRNMWESLVCVLHNGLSDKKRVYEISGRPDFKKKGLYSFLFEDYNCSIDFVRSTFLVKESTFNGKNGSFETLRLDLMDGTTYMYRDADIIIFNTGHWWTQGKTSHGKDYYQEGDYVHPKLKVLEAYKRALLTWSRWVDQNVDQNRTLVIFRGYSVSSFRGGPWNSGGHCNKEKEPIYNETHLAKYPRRMKILEYVLKGMNTTVMYLNISRLTEFRKDGHPSIYRPNYLTAQQEMQVQDCGHWCLPGVPDTWNHLLYVSLLKNRFGSLRD